jgi:hypothetical protein
MRAIYMLLLISTRVINSDRLAAVATNLDSIVGITTHVINCNPLAKVI